MCVDALKYCDTRDVAMQYDRYLSVCSNFVHISYESAGFLRVYPFTGLDCWTDLFLLQEKLLYSF